MRKIFGSLVVILLLISMALTVSAETKTYTRPESRLADTPSKYGFKGLYTLYSPDTYDKGMFGIGVFWDMTRFCLPGDPRYPEVMEFTVGGAYGITDKLEVGVAVPFRSIKIPDRDGDRFADDPAFDEISESGISNVSVGLRYQLIESGNFGLTPYVQVFLPTASDPETGTGADNTRIHVGASAGTTLADFMNSRLYSQVAFQIATDYDQDRRDFTETPPYVAPDMRPRFEEFGTNPLFHEYGNTLFYGAGLAIPFVEDRFELFSELLFYHSFDDDDYIPMFEDGESLDIVQDGGMARVGAKVGFGNGVALTGGWGAKLFAEEPMYESPHYQAFAGLTYHTPRMVDEVVELPDVPKTVEPGATDTALAPIPVEIVVPPGARFDCTQALAMVHFEFDKSTLTPEGIATLRTRRISALMYRGCGRGSGAY
jgi:hypothetical protein